MTRRMLLKQSLAAAGLLLVDSGSLCESQDAPRSNANDGALLLNHVGFPPSACKRLLRSGRERLPYQILESQSGHVVQHGVMDAFKGDMGAYLSASFSSLTQSGTYYVESAGNRSPDFVIASDAYSEPIRKSIAYFSRQRCGDSRTGYHAPCHLDDGRRNDNRQRQDVTGGWHDACDLRKWVDATIYGVIGLTRVLDLSGPLALDRDRILEELRWGNQYFLKMQAPDGFVMNYCGGDDGNCYTDNKPGTADDRLIHVEPCDLPGQFQFIAAQAAMTRHLKATDEAYARTCQASALRCLEWCTTKRDPGAALSLSAAAIACAQLHRAIGGDRFRDLAAGYLRKLIGLQVTVPLSSQTSVTGFFRAKPDSAEPLREIQHGNLPLLALCEALECFADHTESQLWRDSLHRHSEYLSMMANRSAFGTIPYGLYTGKDPGGNRRLGSYWYRWFMKQHDEYDTPDWWVGVNAHLASNGIGLNRAGRLLHDRRLQDLAQCQLDWIVGVNPLNSSTITDVGRNQPRLFVTSEFTPATPQIPGGVMNGLGGSEDDSVNLYSGSYHTCEYWTPMVAYTMWLMAALQAQDSA